MMQTCIILRLPLKRYYLLRIFQIQQELFLFLFRCALSIGEGFISLDRQSIFKLKSIRYEPSGFIYKNCR